MSSSPTGAPRCTCAARPRRKAFGPAATRSSPRPAANATCSRLLRRAPGGRPGNKFCNCGHGPRSHPRHEGRPFSGQAVEPFAGLGWDEEVSAPDGEGACGHGFALEPVLHGFEALCEVALETGEVQAL